MVGAPAEGGAGGTGEAEAHTRACGPRPGPSHAAGAISVLLALVSGRRALLTITHSPDLPKPAAEKAPPRTHGKLFSVKAGLFFLAIMSD